MYAMHTATRAKDVEHLKFMEELFPEEDEALENWIRRTARHVHKLTEYAFHQHIYGTKRTWACHESSRYCFICVLSQMLETLRNCSMDMIEHIDTPLKWYKDGKNFKLKPIKS